MAISKAKNIWGWVLLGILGLLFLFAGAGKLTGSADLMFEAWGYAAWFATVIGVLEVAGGIGLLIPRLAKPAMGGLGIIMLGAAYTHLVSGEAAQVIRPLFFLILLGVACWLRIQTKEASVRSD